MDSGVASAFAKGESVLQWNCPVDYLAVSQGKNKNYDARLLRLPCKAFDLGECRFPFVLVCKVELWVYVLLSDGCHCGVCAGFVI